MVGSFTRESPYLRPSIVQTTFVRVVIPRIVSVSQSVSQSVTQSLIDPHSFIHSFTHSFIHIPANPQSTKTWRQTQKFAK